MIIWEPVWKSAHKPAQNFEMNFKLNGNFRESKDHNSSIDPSNMPYSPILTRNLSMKTVVMRRILLIWAITGARSIMAIYMTNLIFYGN